MESLCSCYMCQADREAENKRLIETRYGPKLVYMEGLLTLCKICGNKRCPHATDHANPCTNSNAPNQKGSMYSDEWERNNCNS